MNKKSKAKKICYKLGEIFKRFKLDEINLSPKEFNISISYENYDKEAAWLMYVELLTRVTTQKLDKDCGDEQSALNSIYSIFDSTRTVLKEKGRKAINFTKISVIVLNKIIRPFTSKWHKLSLGGAFEEKAKCDEFRCELEVLRIRLIKYTQILAEIAGVEDLSFCL